MTTGTNFEDRLLDQLQQVVRANPEPPAAPRGVAVPRRLILAGGVAAAVVAAVLIESGGGGGSNAYALETQPDGSVTVHINSLHDASGLQNRLRAAGIPAVVDYTPACAPESVPAPADGGPSLTHQGADTGGPSLTRGGTDTGGHVTQQAGPGSAKGDVARLKVTSSVRVDGGGVTFTLAPGQIPDGQKVYITTSTGRTDTVAIGIGSQRPPGCTPAP